MKQGKAKAKAKAKAKGNKSMMVPSSSLSNRSKIHVDLLPVLKDNYVYLIHNQEEAWVVDPGEAKPVIEAIQKRKLCLKGVVNTHHHFDHTGGNYKIKEAFSCPIYAPLKGKDNIKLADHWVHEGDKIEILHTEMEVLEVPGHTQDHIALYLKEAQALFSGDALFSLGCGFLFEGSPEQMWESLKRLRNFPDSTFLYCGHEYTLSNARFAKHVDPQNEELVAFYEEISLQVKRGEPTLPSTLGKEKRFNPFLRCDDLDFKEQLGLAHLSHQEVFAHLREQKNHFAP